MRFRLLGEKAVSDCAFEAFGKNEQELFENAAMATLEEMANAKKVPVRIKKTISVSAKDLELLLYNFLAEIILLKDTEGMVFGKIRARITKPKKGINSKTKKELGATATLWGEQVEKLDAKIIRRDVKAVTFYLFKIEKIPKGLKATVVLDI